MNVATAVKSFVPSGDAPGNLLRNAWERLRRVPGGKRIFSRMVGMAAPYTGTIGATVVDVREGYARVTLADRRAVRNHLKSIHAVALVNLAELTGNVALAYSMPADARFIVAGISIEYVKKARGTITGTCECPVPTSNDRVEYEVPVTMHNAAGELVATAILRTLVGPQKSAAH
jgi:uncharacterized protein (TIGR00369 family)